MMLVHGFALCLWGRLFCGLLSLQMGCDVGYGIVWAKGTCSPRPTLWSLWLSILVKRGTQRSFHWLLYFPWSNLELLASCRTLPKFQGSLFKTNPEAADSNVLCKESQASISFVCSERVPSQVRTSASPSCRKVVVFIYFFHQGGGWVSSLCSARHC